MSCLRRCSRSRSLSAPYAPSLPLVPMATSRLLPSVVDTLLALALPLESHLKLYIASPPCLWACPLRGTLSRVISFFPLIRAARPSDEVCSISRKKACSIET